MELALAASLVLNGLLLWAYLTVSRLNDRLRAAVLGRYMGRERRRWH